jgi:hypothetical protein
LRAHPTGVACFACPCAAAIAAPAVRQGRSHDRPAAPPAQAKRGEARLQFLLKQAEIFQHFAPTAVQKAKDTKK